MPHLNFLVLIYMVSLLSFVGYQNLCLFAGHRTTHKYDATFNVGKKMPAMGDLAYFGKILAADFQCMFRTHFLNYFRSIRVATGH